MSRKTNFKRTLSAALALLLCVSVVSCFPASAEGESTTAAAQYSEAALEFVKQKTYSEYFDENVNVKRPDAEAMLAYSGKDELAEVEVTTFEGKDNVLVWSNEEGRVDYTVDVPETGAYQLEVSYYPLDDGASTTELSVLLDGVSPYDTATRATLPHIWTSEYPITTDSKDNEVRPPQVQASRWVTTMVYDVDGLFNEPLYFVLEEGTHTISFESERASVAIEYIKLCNDKGAEAYTKPSDAELSKNSGAAPIRLQGEQYAYTNSQTLFPTYDRGSYLTEPSHPSKQRYNTVGDGTWDTAGQAITWEMNVETAGYYKVGIKARQNELRGLTQTADSLSTVRCLMKLLNRLSSSTMMTGLWLFLRTATAMLRMFTLTRVLTSSALR